MHVSDLDISAASLASLEEYGLTDVESLTAHSASELSELFRVPPMELHEIVCQLNKHRLTLPMHPGFRAKETPGERERNMLRLRIVEGMTFTEIGILLGVQPQWVRDDLSWYFGLVGEPAAVRASKRRHERHQQKHGESR